jgi:L-alanine-DL-glutamate epimerase-like enolase superfamily enzyme
MTYRIDRITVAPLPPLPTDGGTVLPDWAQPALRVPVAQPWSENLHRFAIGVGDDVGNTGWFGPVGGSVAMTVSDQLAPVVTGLDVRAWRAFTDLRPAGRHRSSAQVRMAVSAVELAAWDLRSRVTHTTVESLLGGVARTSVPAYATALGIDIDHPLAPEIAAWIVEQGFWAQKWGLPGYDRAESPQADAARLERIRQAIGDAARLCVDACGTWSHAYGRQMLPVLAECRVTWIEEPGHLDPAAMAAFGLACAAGEHDYDPTQQLASLTAGGVQVWQPDPAWNGGLAHSLRMVELAALHGIPCFPHGTALAVAVRLAALTPATTIPAVEYHLTLEPLRQAIFRVPLIPAEGRFLLNEEPGLTGPYLFPDNQEDSDHAA